MKSRALLLYSILVLVACEEADTPSILDTHSDLGSDTTASDTTASDTTASDTTASDTNTPPPASSLTVYTELDASTASAGDLVQVTCAVRDGDGEAWPLPTTIEVEPGATVKGTVVQPSIAGTTTVTCRLVTDDADAEHVPATLQVEAATAAVVHASLSPDQPFYSVGQVVEVSWVVMDVYGNEVTVDASDVTVTGVPGPGITELEPGRFQLDTEGLFTFEVGVALDGGSISGSVILLVDTTDPVLTLTSYPSGTLDGSPTATITGTVSDALSDFDSLTVNGESVTRDPNGDFTATIDSVQGLNLAVFEATDGAGNTTQAATAWLYSAAYQPVGASPDTNAAPIGVISRLGPSILDDQTWEDIPDDLAQAFWNIGALASAPLATAPSVELSKNRYTGSAICNSSPLWVADLTSIAMTLELDEVVLDPSVATWSLTPRAGGFDVSWTGSVTTLMGIHTLTSYEGRGSRYRASAFSCDCIIGTLSPQTHEDIIAIPVTMDATLTASIDLGKESGASIARTDTPEVLLSNVNYDATVLATTPIEVASWSITGNCGITREGVVSEPLGDMYPGHQAAIDTMIANTDLDAAIRAAFSDAISRRVDAMVEFFDDPEATASFPVPNAGNLSLSTKLDTIAMSTGAIDLGYAGSVGVDRVVVPEASRGPGAITRGDCLTGAGGPDLAGVDEVGLGHHVDLLNQALYAAWVSTTHPFTVSTAGDWSDLLPEGVTLLKISIEQDFPSVVTDCPSGGSRIDLQVGGVTVTVRLDDNGTEYSIRTRLVGTALTQVEAPDQTYSNTPLEPLWLWTETAPESTPPVLADAAAAIAQRATHRALFDVVPSRIWSRLPYPTFALDAMITDGILLTAFDPVTPDNGVYLQRGCIDVGCTAGELRCSLSGDDVDVCAQLTPSCTDWRIEEACSARGMTCNDNTECVCPGVGGELCPNTGNNYSSARCAGTRCRLGCNANYGDCDGDPSNGCELSLTNSNNCGSCGRTCSIFSSCTRNSSGSYWCD